MFVKRQSNQTLHAQISLPFYFRKGVSFYLLYLSIFIFELEFNGSHETKFQVKKSYRDYLNLHAKTNKR